MNLRKLRLYKRRKTWRTDNNREFGQPQAALMGFAVTPELELIFDNAQFAGNIRI
jgi:hypothetical protein